MRAHGFGFLLKAVKQGKRRAAKIQENGLCIKGHAQQDGKKSGRKPVSRVLCPNGVGLSIIYLGRQLPGVSIGLPPPAVPDEGKTARATLLGFRKTGVYVAFQPARFALPMALAIEP